jgi:hypothetical protein
MCCSAWPGAADVMRRVQPHRRLYSGERRLRLALGNELERLCASSFHMGPLAARSSRGRRFTGGLEARGLLLHRLTIDIPNHQSKSRVARHMHSADNSCARDLEALPHRALSSVSKTVQRKLHA